VAVGVAGGEEGEGVAHPGLVPDAGHVLTFERGIEVWIRRTGQAFGRDQGPVVERGEELGGFERAEPGAVVDAVEPKPRAHKTANDQLEPGAAFVGEGSFHIGQPFRSFFCDRVAYQE
jgi:hypothetical protein